MARCYDVFTELTAFLSMISIHRACCIYLSHFYGKMILLLVFEPEKEVYFPLKLHFCEVFVTMVTGNVKY